MWNDAFCVRRLRWTIRKLEGFGVVILTFPSDVILAVTEFAGRSFSLKMVGAALRQAAGSMKIGGGLGVLGFGSGMS